MLARRGRCEVAAEALRRWMYCTERGEIEWPIPGRQWPQIKRFALVYVALNAGARGRSLELKMVELLHLDAALLAVRGGRPLRAARKLLISGNAARIANVDVVARFSAEALQQTGCVKRCHRGTAAAVQHRRIGIGSDDRERADLTMVERQNAVRIF